MQDKKLFSDLTIGILGGGQLGRMTAIAAANMGFKVNCFSPVNGEPAAAEQVVNKVFYADYTDEKALKEFADSVDIITFEFENIPEKTTSFLEKLKPLRPNANAVFITQNRLREKTFLKDNNIPTAKFFHVKDDGGVRKALDSFTNERAIIKTAEFGYDGKGQYKTTKSDDAAKVWAETGFKDAIIEEFVDFAFEVSVVLARNPKGEVAIFPIGRNEHKNGILDISIVPAEISEEQKNNASEIATKIAEKLGYIGIMAVEFFVLKDGTLLVNEIAPRPHNSGHWTMNGCETSQFEQHVRAVTGMEFGSTKLNMQQIKMVNLIGDDIYDLEQYLTNKNAKIHLYGKKEAKKGRKMGHVNILF